MYMMKRYTVATLRSRLAEALDETERGLPVIIERRGVQYRLSVEPATPRRVRKSRPSMIEIVDPAVAEGRWNWEWTATGLKFRGRRRS